MYTYLIDLTFICDSIYNEKHSVVHEVLFNQNIRFIDEYDYGYC